ncbi:MAG: hypothetical protein ACRDG9_13515 [Actinomycetota bacterium]
MRFHRTIATLAGVAVLLLTGAPAGAQAEHDTGHFSVDSTQRSLAPCDEAPGVLTLRGDGVFHVTDTGRTFSYGWNLQAQFTFDPDDPSLPSASGSVVAQHHDNVNYGQLHDQRITDAQHLIAELEDGTTFPIQIRTTLVISADESVEVTVDSVRCGGQAVEA